MWQRLRPWKEADRSSACIRGLRRLAFALFCLPCLALPGQVTRHFGHQVWTTEDGLPQNSVHQVLQTRDGYLWIATEGGLARFDGVSFTVFRREEQPEFASDDIACLAEDTQGALWVGTTDGLVRFADGQFTRISLGHAALPSSVQGLAAAGDGSVLALTAAGVTRIQGSQPVPLPSVADPIETITQAPDHSVWIAAGTHLLQNIAGHFITRADLSSIGQALELHIDSNGAAWIRTPAGIVVRPAEAPVDRRDPSFQKLGGTPPLVNTFLHDSLGELWIGTKRGLFLAATPTSKPVSVEAIGDRSVLSIMRDREGDLWIGTEADGLHILRPQKVQQIPGLGDHMVTALAQSSDGHVWIGTHDDGLRVARPDPAAGQTPADEPRLAAALPSKLVLSLASGPQNDVWVGTLDGLAHLDGGKADRYTSADGLPDDVIRSLLVDDDRSLWIGTRRGLVHWLPGSGNPFQRVNGLPSDLIGALLRSRHDTAGPGPSHPLWVATLDGLSRIDGSSAVPIVHSYKFRAASDADIITSLAEDPSGSLWIGTRSHGLARMTGSDLQTVSQAVLPRNINSLLADARGYLWLGTPRGIFRVSTDDLGRCLVHADCSLPVARFGYADGMLTEETTASGHPAALLAADGTLWFATTKGIATLTPATMHETAVPPPVVLQRFSVDNQNQPLAAPSLHFPFGHTSLAFDYVGLSFAAPARVQYRYQLEGFDKQWTEAGTRRTAYYTSLPPGTYTFRVQAANSDGIWNRTGAQLAFTILPPFYRRASFYLLVALALTSLAYAIYYLRVRQLRSQFDAVLAERSRIAREIHDTLAQNFVGISIQLQIAEQLLAVNNTAAISEQLVQTRALVQEGLNDARQSIWELRASVAQDSLPTRISRAVERSARDGIEEHVTIGGIYRPLDAAIEKEVLRVAQEALANVARHAHATAVNIELRYDSDRLLLAVVDNGKGFDPDTVSTAGDHFGLQGMRERAAGLGATLSVTSTPGGGTSLRLAVPLPKPERRTV